MRTATALLAAALATPALAQDLDFSFDNGVAGWRTVLDGVMGGRSSGRITAPETGILRFAGDLSLENNGGFSQMRSNVPAESLVGATGIELRVKGDGRTYNFDIRASNVRLMAGGFQQSFETVKDTWTTIELPFEEFKLYSFGRKIPNAPALEPAKIESLGITLSDKNEGSFRIEVDSIRALGAESSPAPSQGNDLATVARSAGLTTLLDLVAAAELDLPADQQVTIFAPTNEAFAALPRETVEALLAPEGRDTLRAILTYHVAGAQASSADLFQRSTIDSLNGQRLSVNPDFTIADANLVATDVEFDGGIVHVIDAVLMPELDAIGKLLTAVDDLSTLEAAVTAAGLTDQLSAENGPWTVFAPVNSAFAALPEGTLDSLLQTENRSQLIEILGLHVVPGRVYANEMLASRSARTYFGNPVSFAITNGKLSVDNATIVKVDIETANGVVHLIDSVILPTNESTQTFTAEASEQGVRLLELAISRGAPLFNKGQVAACAALYEITIEALVTLANDELGSNVTDRLQLALAEAETEDDARERAWIFRRAIDDTYPTLLAQSGRQTEQASR